GCTSHFSHPAVLAHAILLCLSFHRHVFFPSRRRHTISLCDWSSDVCSSDLPSHASFNGGPVGAGTFYWGGVHGTWFWVDPVNDIVVVGMFQQQDGGNPMTGRPYPAPDPRAMTRSIVYGALVDPAV